MDPNANLALIDSFLRLRMTGEEVDEMVDNLAGWLATGGFAPDWERYPLGTSYFNTRQAQARARERRRRH